MHTFLRLVAVENTAGGVENNEIESVNITDEEKEKLKTSYTSNSSQSNETNRPFLETVLSVLDCTENDYLALLALCLVYALANNKGKFFIRLFIFISFNIVTGNSTN